MKKFERLAEARAPDGTMLALFRHDGAYVIQANGVELMSTRRHHSEDLLAELVCAPLAGRSGVRTLVGGLGLGFTLRAALAVLPADGGVVVAELLPEVIAWNRNPEYGLADRALADSRVTLVQGDVATLLAAEPNGFDGIMLDVDNGAEPFTTRENGRLYTDPGLELTIRALRPGGRVAYWSAERDPRFARALRRAGLEVEEVRARAHATSGGWYTLYVGLRRR